MKYFGVTETESAPERWRAVRGTRHDEKAASELV